MILLLSLLFLLLLSIEGIFAFVVDIGPLLLHGFDVSLCFCGKSYKDFDRTVMKTIRFHFDPTLIIRYLHRGSGSSSYYLLLTSCWGSLAFSEMAFHALSRSEYISLKLEGLMITERLVSYSFFTSLSFLKSHPKMMSSFSMRSLSLLGSFRVVKYSLPG